MKRWWLNSQAGSCGGCPWPPASLESVPESFGDSAIADPAEDVVGDRIAQVSVEDAAVPAVANPFRETSYARPGIASVSSLRRRVRGLHADHTFHRLRVGCQRHGLAIVPQPEPPSGQPSVDQGLGIASPLAYVGLKAAQPVDHEVAVIGNRFAKVTADRGPSPRFAQLVDA